MLAPRELRFPIERHLEFRRQLFPTLQIQVFPSLKVLTRIGLKLYLCQEYLPTKEWIDFESNYQRESKLPG